MNLYYAIGGGLGHLTRARAFLHTFGIEKDAVILTASSFAEDKRIVGDIHIIKADENLAQNKKTYNEFLKNVFAEFPIEKLFLDAFPVGIGGEFCDFDFGTTEVFYIARMLKWKNYSRLLCGKIPRFKKTFILETLKQEHQNFIDENSATQIELKLKYPDTSSLNEKIEQKIHADKSPFWLIVHAGSVEETNELYLFAKELCEIEGAEVDLIVISPNKSSFPNHYNIYPASILFPHATRIFTAGGFNVVEQTEEFREKHFAVPMERRFDDQFARVSRFAALAKS